MLKGYCCRYIEYTSLLRIEFAVFNKTADNIIILFHFPFNVGLYSFNILNIKTRFERTVIFQGILVLGNLNIRSFIYSNRYRF